MSNNNIPKANPKIKPPFIPAPAVVSVNRYSIVSDFQAPWAKMHEFRSGEWVKYEDYANIKEEFDKYKKAVTISVDGLIDERNTLNAKLENSNHFNTELLALSNRQASDIRKLTKAGDMCDQLLACFETEGRIGVNIGRDMWRVAKEGNNSV